MMFEKGLTKLGMPAKLLITLFLCTMGLGYLFSLYTLYLGHKDADGMPGLSMNDIIVTYYGNREGSILEAKSVGSMSTYYTSDADRAAVIGWVRTGAPREGYEPIVSPILVKSCTMCHAKDGTESTTPLTTYDEVMKYVTVSTGVQPLRLGSLAHTHLISHGVMFFLLSLIFLMTRVKDRWKIVLVFLAYFGIVVDVMAWCLAKTAVFFTYFIVLGGGVLGVTFLFFFFVPMWELWIRRK